MTRRALFFQPQPGLDSYRCSAVRHTVLVTMLWWDLRPKVRRNVSFWFVGPCTREIQWYQFESMVGLLGRYVVADLFGLCDSCWNTLHATAVSDHTHFGILSSTPRRGTHRRGLYCLVSSRFSLRCVVHIHQGILCSAANYGSSSCSGCHLCLREFLGDLCGSFPHEGWNCWGGLGLRYSQISEILGATFLGKCWVKVADLEFKTSNQWKSKISWPSSKLHILGIHHFRISLSPFCYRNYHLHLAVLEQGLSQENMARLVLQGVGTQVLFSWQC